MSILTFLVIAAVAFVVISTITKVLYTRADKRRQATQAAFDNENATYWAAVANIEAERARIQANLQKERELVASMKRLQAEAWGPRPVTTEEIEVITVASTNDPGLANLRGYDKFSDPDYNPFLYDNMTDRARFIGKHRETPHIIEKAMWDARITSVHDVVGRAGKSGPVVPYGGAVGYPPYGGTLDKFGNVILAATLVDSFSSPSVPETDTSPTFEGHGGSSGGAGATESYSAPDPSPSIDTSPGGDFGGSFGSD
jgi:hypothetical protein